MSKLTRAFLDSLLPPGALWFPEEDGDFGKLLEGMADNVDEIKALLDDLAFIRDPANTTILDDLEREFGVVQGQGATEAERRLALASVKYSKGGNGDPDFLENLLRDAGFDVYVHPNDPPVDPETILDTNAYYLAGRQGTYNVSLTSDDWSLVFIIGGTATYGGSGELLTVAIAAIPADSAETFKRLVKRTMPLHAWGAIKVVAYKTPYFGFSTDPDADTFGTTASDDGGYFSYLA